MGVASQIFQRIVRAFPRRLGIDYPVLAVQRREPGMKGGEGSSPTTPATLSASNGTFEDRVAVSWEASAEATTYRLYRSTVEGESGILVFTGAATAYEDLSVAPSTNYFYSAAACNFFGCSEPTDQDRGYIRSPSNGSATGAIMHLLL